MDGSSEYLRVRLQQCWHYCGELQDLCGAAREGVRRADPQYSQPGRQPGHTAAHIPQVTAFSRLDHLSVCFVGVPDPDTTRPLEPDQRQEWPAKKDVKNFHALKVRNVFFGGAWGFSCSLKAFYRKLKTKVMHFLFNRKKFSIFCSTLKFLNFCTSKPGSESGSGFAKKALIRIQ
jgi:hypothetical protein